MALARLKKDEVYRFGLASKRAFVDWQNPTASELNANPTNDPNGLIFKLSCALDTDGSTFDLGDSERDESLSFCQSAGDSSRMAENPEVVFQFFRSAQRWAPASSTLASDGYNTANLAFSLMAWRGVDYFAYLSIGKDVDAPFVTNDEIRLVGVTTDWGIDVIGTGENARMQQTFATTGDVAWRVRVA